MTSSSAFDCQSQQLAGERWVVRLSGELDLFAAPGHPSDYLPSHYTSSTSAVRPWTQGRTLEHASAPHRRVSFYRPQLLSRLARPPAAAALEGGPPLAQLPGMRSAAVAAREGSSQ